MKRRLLILRHAKSDRDGDAAQDFDRPLSNRGHRDAPRTGAWLKTQGLKPDLILSSPAARARETAIAIADALGLARRDVVEDERLYLASLDTLLEVLAATPVKTGAVLLVGHNPGLDALVEYLAADPPARTAAGKLMTTAAVAWFETDDPWRKLEPGGGRLVALMRPKEQ